MTESTDPYLIPGTEVLKNLRDIRESEILNEFEADAAARRLIELAARTPQGKFDTSHLRSIHQHIFQDVYAWAGQFRTVNISKGGHSFAHADFIEPALDTLFRKLAAENHLNGLTPQPFAARAAFFLGEINAAHPFREGNGRTQREFIRQLAIAAGFSIHWRHITRDQMTAASRSSFLTGNVDGLKALIAPCLTG